MLDQLQVETCFMLNIEITFPGVREWFNLAGHTMDDAALFRALFMPNKLPTEIQIPFAQLVFFRHEDIFFQMHRNYPPDNPLHQLLIRLHNVRTLRGDDEALIDLWEALKWDRDSAEPKYKDIHHYFS